MIIFEYIVSASRLVKGEEKLCIEIIQFYSGTLSTDDPTNCGCAQLYGGAQDNGVDQYQPTQVWNEVDGGDGGMVLSDYTGLAVTNEAHPVWMDTRNPDLALCPGTGVPGVPPKVCTFTSVPNGPVANDQEIFTSVEAILSH